MSNILGKYKSITKRLPCQLHSSFSTLLDGCYINIYRFPIDRLCHNSENRDFVILNEVKNLMISISCKAEILRLAPQNDITT